jgi:hypothetical protein
MKKTELLELLDIFKSKMDALGLKLLPLPSHKIQDTYLHMYKYFSDDEKLVACFSYTDWLHTDDVFFIQLNLGDNQLIAFSKSIAEVVIQNLKPSDL